MTAAHAPNAEVSALHRDATFNDAERMVPAIAQRTVENASSSFRGRAVSSLIVPLLRKRRRFESAGALARAIELDRARGPALPPKQFRRRFAINESVEHGMRVFTVRPLAGAQNVTVLYLPGGGYVFQPIAAHWTLVAGLAESCGATIVVPIYPLAPDKTAIDGFAAVTALYRDLHSRRGNGAVLVGGDSAGGGLTLSLAQQWRDEGASLPDGLILFAPLGDATASDPAQVQIEPRDFILTVDGIRAVAKLWAGELALDDPRISPLNGSLSGLPPMLLIVGEDDILSSDAERLYTLAVQEQARIEMHIYPRMFHVFMAVDIPEGRRALSQSGTFVQQIAKNMSIAQC